MTLPGTTFPFVSFKSLLAVINSSIPLVPICQQASLTPLASEPFLRTSSSIIPCFSATSPGIFSCLFDESSIGSVRSSDTVVKSVERWERVCDMCEVALSDGGSKSGSGPRRRDEESGLYVDMWDSSVGDEGGSESVLA